jgi:membrane protein YqaA with SNARE-associated domain
MTVMAFIFHNKHKSFQRYGYLGIFLTILVSNLSIFSPANLVVTVLGGRVLNPIVVGLVAALGCILGEILAYEVGSSGTAVLEDKAWFTKVHGFMQKNGFLTLFVITALPNPAVSFSGIIAGALQYPFFKFLLASFTGNWLQYTYMAVFGKLSKRIW